MKDIFVGFTLVGLGPLEWRALAADDARLAAAARCATDRAALRLTSDKSRTAAAEVYLVAQNLKWPASE